MTNAGVPGNRRFWAVSCWSYFLRPAPPNIPAVLKTPAGDKPPRVAEVPGIPAADASSRTTGPHGGEAATAPRGTPVPGRTWPCFHRRDHTDALEVGALSAFGSTGQKAVTAAGVGMDLILCSARGITQAEAAPRH